jgi:hypothetical protein
MPRPYEGEDLERTVYIKIDDLDLNTPEGQNLLLIRVQTALATENLNPLDVKILVSLKDMIKTKSNLDVVRMLQNIKKELDEMKALKK